MKTVLVAGSPLAAHLAAGLLREAGIAVVVEGENLQGAFGDIPVDLTTRPAVRVLRDEDADRAVAILNPTQIGGGDGDGA